MEELTPIKIVKVTSNDTMLLVYLPSEIRKSLGLTKGNKLIFYVNKSLTRIVLEKIRDSEEIHRTS